jgi:hypothetical protein
MSETLDPAAPPQEQPQDPIPDQNFLTAETPAVTPEPLFPDQTPSPNSFKQDPKAAAFVSEAYDKSYRWMAKMLDTVDAIKVPDDAIDKVGMRQGAAATAVIQHLTGLDPVEISNNYVALRKGVAARWGENTPKTDAEFLAQAKTHINGSLNYGQALTNAFNQGVTDHEDPKNPKNPLLGEQEWNTANASLIASSRGGISPMDEKDVHGDFAGMYDKGAALAQSPYFPMVKETYDFFRGGSTPKDWTTPVVTEGMPEGIATKQDFSDSLKQQILALSKDQQNEFFSNLAQYSQAKGDDKASMGQWFGELGNTLARSTSSIAENIAEPFQRHYYANVSDIGKLYGVPEMQDYAERGNQALDIRNRLNDAADNTINPLHEYGIGTDITRGVVGALPWMAGFAINPAIGMAAMGLSNVGQVQGVLRQNNPNMSQDEIERISIPTAAAMTAFQSISMGSAFKAFPWLEQRIATTFGGGAINQIAHMGVTTAGMNAADAVQILGQKVAQAFDPEVKMGSPASDQMVDLMFRLPESAGTFAILTLAGAGIHKLQGGDSAKMQALAVETAKGLRDEVALRASGWSNEQIIDAQNAPLSEVLQTVINIQADIRASAREEGKEIANKSSILSRLYADSPETPTMIQLDNGDWRIMVPDSKGVLQPAGDTSDFDVANSRLMRLERFHASGQLRDFNALLDHMQEVWNKQGIENRTVETPSEPGKTVQDFMDAKESNMSEAELRLRVALAGGHENDSLSQSIINGYTSNEWKNKVYTDIIKVLDHSPETALHESSDAHTNRAIAMGKFTHADLAKWIRQTEAGMKAIDGKDHQYLKPEHETSPAAIVEAHTQLFLDYAGGKFNAYKAAPSALRGFFKSMLRYFKHVLAKAKILHQAIEAGTVPKDYHQHLAETMGLGMEEQMSPMEARATAELMGATASTDPTRASVNLEPKTRTLGEAIRDGSQEANDRSQKPNDGSLRKQGQNKGNVSSNFSITPSANPIREALDKYEENDEIQDFGDLVDYIDNLAGETGNADLDTALYDYRKSVEEDYKMYGGRGDPEEYESKFLADLAHASDNLDKEANGEPIHNPDGTVSNPDETIEAGTPAPDTDASEIDPSKQEGDGWQDIPWTEETNFSIKHLPTAYTWMSQKEYDKILKVTDTIAGIHIDRMRVGEYLGIDLQGGMYYPTITENLKKRVLWAFNSSGVARTVARRAAENGGYVKLILMQEGNVIGNKTFGHIWFEQVRRSIADGSLTEKTALDALNSIRERYKTKKAIKDGTGDFVPKMVKNKKTGKMEQKMERVKGTGEVYDKDYTGHHEEWTSLAQAQKDILAMTQTKRASTYFSKTKTKTKAKGEGISYGNLLSQKMTAAGLPDAAKIVDAIEEPSFKGVPKGAAVAILKFDPVADDAKIQTGKQAGVTPHLSYNYVLHGEPVARMKKFKVVDVEFPETKNRILTQAHTNFPLERSVSFSIKARDEAYDAAVKSGGIQAFKGKLKSAVDSLPDPMKSEVDFDYEKGSVEGLVEGFFMPAFSKLGAFVDWHNAATGSQYITIKIPTENETYKDAVENGGDLEEHKITIRDHNVSPFRAKEFGSPTKVIQVDDFNTKENVLHAATRLSDHLSDILEPYREYLAEKANSDAITDTGVAGIKTPTEGEADKSNIANDGQGNGSSLTSGDLQKSSSDGKTSFSIRTKAEQDRVTAEFERHMQDSPEKRREIMERAAARFGRVQSEMDEINRKIEAKGTETERAEIRRQMSQNLATLGAIMRTLPAEIRGEFGNPYGEYAKKVGDKAKANYLVDIIGRISHTIDANLRESFLQKAYDLYDNAAPSRSGNKVTGKVTPDTYRELKEIYDLWHMSAAEVDAKIDSLKNEYSQLSDNKDLTDEEKELQRRQILRNIALTSLHGNFAPDRIETSIEGTRRVPKGSDNPDKSALESEQVVNYLQDLIDGGRQDVKAAKELRSTEIKARVSDLTKLILGRKGKAITPDVGSGKDAARGFLNGLRKIRDVHFTNTQLLDHIFGSKEGTELADRIYRAVNEEFDNNHQDEQAATRFLLDGIVGTDAPRGFKTEKVLKKALASLSTRKSTGISTKENLSLLTRKILLGDARNLSKKDWKGLDYDYEKLLFTLKRLDGNPKSRTESLDIREIDPESGDEVKDLQLSEFEAMQRLLLFRQTRYRRTLELSGMNADVASKLEAFVNKTREGQTFYSFLKDHAFNNYERLNAQFEKQFGVPMPRIDNYAPASGSWEIKDDEDEARLLGEHSGGASTTPGFAIERQNHVASLKDSNAWTNYMAHTRSVNYWLSHVELNRDLQATLGSREVKRALQTRGKNEAEQVSGILKSIAKEDMTPNKVIRDSENMARAFASYGATSILGLNPKVAVKHLTSAVSAAMVLDPMEFLSSAKNVATGQGILPLADSFVSKEVMRFVQASHGDLTREGVSLANRSGTIQDLAVTGQTLGEVAHSWIPNFMRLSNTATAAIVYDASYRSAKADGVSDEVAHEIAKDRVNAALHRVNPVGFSVDQPSLEAKHPIVALIQRFAGPVRQGLGIVLHELTTLKRDVSEAPEGQKASTAVNKLVKAGAAWALPGLVEAALIQGMSTLIGSQQEREDSSSLDEYLAAMLAGRLYGFFWVGASLSQAAKSWITGKPTFQTNLFPPAQYAQELARSGKKIFGGKGQTEDYINAAKSGVDMTAGALIILHQYALASALGGLSATANLARPAIKTARNLGIMPAESTPIKHRKGIVERIGM